MALSSRVKVELEAASSLGLIDAITHPSRRDVVTAIIAKSRLVARTVKLVQVKPDAQSTMTLLRKNLLKKELPIKRLHA